MISSALLLAAALGQTPGGEFGWSCSVAVTIDDYSGSVSRNFGDGLEAAPYLFQVQRQTGDIRHDVIWSVFPRPEGPPPDGPPGFLNGRREADAFSTGPDYVHIDFRWHTQVVGPVWAHYWGDGAYAGADLLMTARHVRRFTDRDGRLGGLSGGLATRPILTALAPAQSWTVVVNDATGKQLFTETFEVPRRELAEAEFRRARAIMDRLEAHFRLDHRPRSEGGATCGDDPPPEAVI